MQLRPYQQECIDSIPNSGSYLIQMATGLGKTVTFANVPHSGKMLILSHREELVRQPLKYFNCSTGIEMSTTKSNGEEVISASVQSLVRRLDRFSPDEFDIIITDEAHHAAAKTYRKIFSHFKSRLHLGFTATPNRSDSVRLDDIYQDIIFQRDLRWGIENDYLSDIYCKRVNIGFDLSAVRTQHGDYAPGELDKAMDGTADAIAEAYRDHAKGATLIFAVSVDQVNQIVDRIPGAVAVTGETKNRSDIIEAFSKREIPCLVNCMVFTEGTDIPLVETVIIARPTQSDSLYAQMVGRGLRRHPDKEILHLIDCVGVTGKASLCTAPSLLGIDLDQIPKKKAYEVQGLLFDLPEMAIRASDTPESWIRNVEIVQLWSKKQKYQNAQYQLVQAAGSDNDLLASGGQFIKIPPADELGMVLIGNKKCQCKKRSIRLSFI
jgi:superfamily II DNA or RNA helicase